MVGRIALLLLLVSSTAFSRETLRLKRDKAHHHNGPQHGPIYAPQQSFAAPVVQQYNQLPVQQLTVPVPQYAAAAPVQQYAQQPVVHVAAAQPQYALPVAPQPQYTQPAAAVVPAQHSQPAPVQPIVPAQPQYSQPIAVTVPEPVPIAPAPVPAPPAAPLPEAVVPPATEAPAVVQPTTAVVPAEAPATSRNYANAPPVTVPPVGEELVSSTDVPAPVISANASAEKPKEESQWAKGSIPFVLEQIGFNSFNDLLILAGIENMFEKEGPITVLVPPDAAFDALSQRFGGMEAALDMFNKNPEGLTSLLKGHVIPGVVPSNVLVNNFVGRSILGTPLRVKYYEAEDNEWKPIRVATVNGARVIRTDIPATNGMIHIIDRPLFPVPSADIYSTLKNHPEQKFKTLVSAIEQAGLVQVLANPLAGPFTVFAPTDKAFSMVSRVELAPVLSDPARLAKLLQRHVVQDLVYTAGLQGFQKAYALNFELLYIYHGKGMTKVNGANVVDPDMSALNGVIHSIDSVLGF